MPTTRPLNHAPTRLMVSTSTPYARDASLGLADLEPGAHFLLMLRQQSERIARSFHNSPEQGGDHVDEDPLVRLLANSSLLLRSGAGISLGRIKFRSGARAQPVVQQDLRKFAVVLEPGPPR